MDFGKWNNWKNKQDTSLSSAGNDNIFFSRSNNNHGHILNSSQCKKHQQKGKPKSSSAQINNKNVNFNILKNFYRYSSSRLNILIGRQEQEKAQRRKNCRVKASDLVLLGFFSRLEIQISRTFSLSDLHLRPSLIRGTSLFFSSTLSFKKSVWVKP